MLVSEGDYARLNRMKERTEVAALRGLAVLALGLAAAFLGAAAFLVVVALAAGFLAVGFLAAAVLVVLAFCGLELAKSIRWKD